MKLTKGLTALLIIGSLTTAVATTTRVFAADSSSSSTSSTNVQTTVLSKSYIVYGAGASNHTEIANVLGATSDYTALTTTGTDASYIGLSGVADSTMISSVSLTPATTGAGTLVNIKDYDGQNNITTVTSQQYAMAATMAGVNDIIINVTSDKSVTGEAALAGVYKALAADGISLNEENTQAANSVLSATSDAIADNSDDKSYPGKLTSAVTDTSADLAEKKQAGTTITLNIIGNTLNTNLEKQGIADQTSDTAKTAIVNSLKLVVNAPISDSKSFVENAQNLADKLKNSTGDLMAKAKDFANSADAKQATNWFVEHVVNPVKNWIQSIFSKN